MLGVRQVREGGGFVRVGQVRESGVCVRGSSGKGGRGLC